MSHHATNWAIQQRGLKPATKIVLWHLADCHNPSQGCFPSQEYLVDACEMSRSSLNDHLRQLEDRGLVRREQRVDHSTKRQMSTRYVFSFEADFCDPQDVVEPCPDSGHGAVSEKSPEPCPKKAPSRVRISDTNPVIEPVIEPRRAQERAGGGFNILWGEWALKDRPGSRQAAEKAWEKIPQHMRPFVIEAARCYREAMIRRRQKPRMITFLRSEYPDFVDPPSIDKDGDFIITSDRPEWPNWLGAVRRQHGEPGVLSVLRLGKMVRKTRWPPSEGSIA